MLRERLRGRRAARLVSGNVWIGAGSISGGEKHILGSSCYFYLGWPGGFRSDSFQMNNNLNQNLRGGIVMTRALEIV